MKGERESGLVRRDDAAAAASDWEMEGGERSLPPLSFRPVAASGRGWWGRTVLLAVFIVVLIECAFIVRLDILNTSSTSSSYYSSLVDGNADAYKLPGNDEIRMKLNMTAGRNPIKERRRDSFVADDMCSEGWLEKADRVKYSRDFKKDPVLVSSGETEVLALSFYSFVWTTLVLRAFI